ncbi:type IV toxin-antitoxin system AbiEi family antitoxin [Microbacterium sp. M1A1_1b]|uniref:type IV toxin-antitoxin system AbiEi family antitoxin n=1 Tax=Curtobacterium sp. VKM Ac-2922 TaxID=2929475 RepID=UPI001FB3C323|nr:type IV toxin-antitoxin system AbiEi family antitoxin [Curtobacterium sp. VKM Ac-2922]MCJ1714853.1 hypothetical protein [Curtobacterium sp. VKM Ac-2922]
MCSSRLLTTDDWPETELRAAVLAGELVMVGACWASVAEPQDPALRAASFAWSAGDERVVAAGRSAAWIWGACSRPPLPHDACVPAGQRIRQNGGEPVREVAITSADTVRIGGATVTTPVRTALDLLRVAGPSAWASRSEVVRGLLDVGLVTPPELGARLRALGTAPMVRQAERRLREVLTSGGL